MRDKFEHLDPKVRQAFARLVTSAADPRASQRADWALARALPAFEDLLDGPSAPDPDRDHLDEAYDRLRVCVLFEELRHRWDMPYPQLEELWEQGQLRSRLEAELRPAAARV